MGRAITVVISGRTGRYRIGILGRATNVRWILESDVDQEAERYGFDQRLALFDYLRQS